MQQTDNSQKFLKLFPIVVVLLGFIFVLLAKYSLIVFFPISISIVVIFLLINFFISERISLQNNNLKINRFLKFRRFPTVQNGQARYTYNFHLLKSLDLSLDQITKIGIETTTPLIPLKKSVNEINWRDNVYIFFNTNLGEETEVLSAFDHPDLRDIIMKIVSLKPNIEVVFRKTTPLENLWRSGEFSVPTSSGE